MKTLHLNLAAKPYRDYRPVYAVAAVAGLITAVLMIYNLQTAFRYLVETRQTRTEITVLEEETTRERATTKALETQLSTIDVRTLDAQARYINTQIRERAFSWSALMQHLESVIPGDIRLMDLNPSVDEDGGVSIALSCVTRKPDGMTDLLDRLFADAQFRDAFPTTVRSDPDGTKSFTIQVTYLPNAPAVKR